MSSSAKGSEEPLNQSKPSYGAAPASAPQAAKSSRGSTPFMASSSPPLYVALNPLIWILWLLDFLFWLLNPIALARFFAACCRGNKSIQGPNGSRRSVETLVTTPFDGASTMHDCLQVAFEKYANLKCMGTRKFEGMYKPEGARFPLKVFGPTSWITYREAGDTAKAFGAGLRNLGLEPMSGATSEAVLKNYASIDGPNCILIFEETCATWTMATIGALGQSIAVATSYATLGMDAVGEALNETQSPAIVCNYKDVSKVSTLASSCPNLKTIIYTRNYVEEDKPALSPEMGGLKVISFDEVVALGQQNPVEFAPPTAEHVALIMYTSGSTGKPKGVMIKQSGLVGSVAGLEGYFLNFSPRATTEYNQETYLAYLPAAHILEFSAEMSMISHGAAIGYADPKTISSAGAIRKLPDGTLNTTPTGHGKNPPGAIQEFAPTVMAAVPKIWDILKKGVESNVGNMTGAKGAIIRALFHAGFAARHAAIHSGRSTPLFDAILFKKFYQLLGGRIKLAVSGGGPISSEIQNFIRVAFKFNLVQGYGLTETNSSGTVQPHWSTLDGVAGAPVDSVELRLNNCTEVLDRENKPYLNTDTSHLGSPCLGRGEVWIRGSPVAAGYYLMREKSKTEFDSSGWFHTGDIGMWLPNGMLKIVDRLKNLVKLKGGEYIAIEAMEAVYAESVFVNGLNGGIMCYGDGDMDRPVALLQVNGAELKKWASSAGVSFSTVEELCEMPEAQQKVLDDLRAIGKGRLGGNELLVAVGLLPGTGAPDSASVDAPWTPENQYLTASNKLNRKPILMGFSSLMDPLKQKGIR